MKFMQLKNWFSNFVPFDTPLITVDPGFEDAISYITPEHFYQAMKSVSHADHLLIASAKTPGLAKKFGRRLVVRPDWDSVKLNFMFYALVYKFTKNTSHGQKLINTPGPIVEYNYWHDNYWGDCICEKCENIVGQNWLGRILENIRTKISV